MIIDLLAGWVLARLHPVASLVVAGLLQPELMHGQLLLTGGAAGAVSTFVFLQLAIGG